MGSGVKFSIGAAVCALLILTAVLIGVSFKQLDANEVGLVYDSFAMKLDTETLHTAGTKFVGVASKYIVFPSTQLTLNFADYGVSARTKDGMPITILCNINYRLKTNAADLSRLYMLYGEMEEIDELYRRISRNVIRTAAARYEIFQYFQDKRPIQDDMRNTLNTEMDMQGAIVEAFNLQDFTLPSAFSSARSRLANAGQQLDAALNDLAVARINAQSQVNVFSRQAALIVSDATNNAAQAQLGNQAAIDSLVARYAAERQGYMALRQQLNLTSSQLLSMVWLDAQADALAASAAGTRPTVVNLAVPAGF